MIYYTTDEVEAIREAINTVAILSKSVRNKCMTKPQREAYDKVEPLYESVSNKLENELDGIPYEDFTIHEVRLILAVCGVQLKKVKVDVFGLSKFGSQRRKELITMYSEIIKDTAECLRKMEAKQ